MEQKSEEMGAGMREREHAELWNMYGFIRKKKEKKLGSDLGRGRRLPIPNIAGDEWENQSNQGKKH